MHMGTWERASPWAMFLKALSANMRGVRVDGRELHGTSEKMTFMHERHGQKMETETACMEDNCRKRNPLINYKYLFI